MTSDDARHALDVAEHDVLERVKARRNGPKLRCPQCLRYTSVVVPEKGGKFGAVSEAGEDCYRRLRECLTCHTRFSSVERFERIIRRGAA